MSFSPAPGHHSARLLRLIRQSIAGCSLDLRGSVVLTEAATGPYVVTPVVAAMAGAKCVYAITRASRHGTVEEISRDTEDLATRAGVSERIRIVTEKSGEVLGAADIITNSGHVRPIDRAMVMQLKSTAVVPLMYEGWEYRSTDVDLTACREKGIPVAGTNERHPEIDVFSYLGVMAMKLLLDAGVSVYGSHLLLLCDNPFAPYIEQGLAHAGADVFRSESLAKALGTHPFDAIIVALRPGLTPSLGEEDARTIAAAWEGAVVAQFWGDLPRGSFAELGIPLWPAAEPAPGHMGILPSAVGPEPVVRLQVGGLKVGELLWRARSAGLNADNAVRSSVQAGFSDSGPLVS